MQAEMNVYPLLVPNAALDEEQSNNMMPQPEQPVVGYVEPKGTVALERRFGPHVLVRLAHNVQGEIPIPYVGDLDTNLPDLFLSYPQLVTQLDYRDDPIHTHKGFFLSNDLQVAFGSVQDVRIAPEVRGYIPIATGVTFAARAQLGFLFPQNGDYVHGNSTADTDRETEILYFRGFFSGGPSSNRGFPLRGIAPHEFIPFLNPATAQNQALLNCNALTNPAAKDNPLCRLPVGGFSQWEASAEVRFVLSGPLGAALFCDAGDVSPNQLDIRLKHLHLSCGGGLRYDTPLGPIRLDVAYRIQPLQVLGYADEAAIRNADPTEGIQPRLFGKTGDFDSGVPIGISFGILESF
jgi:outer membrane protein insertion porin family/translocation and assembly module TamA